MSAWLDEAPAESSGKGKPCLVCRRRRDAKRVVLDGGAVAELCDQCAADRYRRAEAARRLRGSDDRARADRKTDR